MRDIRADLEDRAQQLKDQIKSAESTFAQHMETIQRAHEKTLENLKIDLDAVNSLLESENRRLNSAQAPDTKSQSQERGVQKAQPKDADLTQKLTDFIIRELSDSGPVSKDDLLKMAVRQGYVGDNADRSLEQALAHLKNAGPIRELPNGTFALPSLAETIMLRRAG